MTAAFLCELFAVRWCVCWVPSCVRNTMTQVMSTYERRYTYCEHNMHATIFTFLQVRIDWWRLADSMP